MQFIDQLRSAVIPVIVIENPDDAVPLARTLAGAGLSTLEITLRTPAAVECIRRIHAEFPQLQLGAGTLTRTDEIDQVLNAGASFALAPGLSDTLVAATRAAGLDYVPGVMTPSEVMRAAELGCQHLKLFPAEQCGGMAMLKALAGPFAQIRFCPTGGIDAVSAPQYLSLPNVFAVGGSWMVPATALRERAWERIGALAAQAAQLGIRPGN